MTKYSPEERTALAQAARRSNLFVFLQSAFSVLHPGKELAGADYVETLCFHLQELAEGRERRLLVTLPPRYLKSVVAAIVFPAWYLGLHPEKQVVVACYGDTLARDHSLLFRKLVQSKFYRETFPGVGGVERGGRLHEFRTSRNGGRRAVTLGGAVTGLGADLIVVDDLMKASDAGSEARRSEVREFFDGTLMSRLNDKRTGAVLAIQQRLHQDDLPAHLLEKGGYAHLNLPAIARENTVHNRYFNFVWERQKGEALCPEREDLETLRQSKHDMGAGLFETQYQQDPAAGGSSMIDVSKLTLIDGKPSEFRFLKVVQCWDTAVKDNPDCDYSVCATFGWDDERWLLIDVVRERLDFGNLKSRALQLRNAWGAEHIIVEDSANGTPLVQDLRAAGFYEFTTVKVKDDKAARFGPAAEWLQDGRVGILHQSSWFGDFRRELLAFPNGCFDDQVDAISLFVKKQRGRRAVDPQRAGLGFQLREEERRKRESLERRCGVTGIRTT